MVKRFYVFEERGPYGWRRAKYTTGPHYDDVEWFDTDGYKSQKDAEHAIKRVLTENEWLGPFFVLEGFSKE